MRYLIILSLVFLCGCALLGTAIETIPEVESEEVIAQANALQVVLDTLIPMPYKIPASMGLGYLICLLRRIWKKKHGCKN